MDSTPAFRPTPTAGCLPLTAEREADLRKAVIAEALCWVNTPYRQAGYVKGPNGAVDCSMLLVGAWVGGGVFEPFDPRPYPADWHMHHERERYLEWMGTVATEIEVAKPGDVVVWKSGRAFAHAGIIVNDLNHVVHALGDIGHCTVSDMNEAFLMFIDRAGTRPRPRKFFDVFAPLRAI